MNNNNNNRRPLGNIINRVFESAGPDGKVRGTPQQIIDKYQGLARDAQLAGDRVAAESFLQHSEHYTRMLGEAQAQQNDVRQGFERDDGPRDDAGREDGRRDDGRRDEFRRDDVRRDEPYDQPRPSRQEGQNPPQPQRQPQPQPQAHQPQRPPQHQPAISSGLAMIDPAEDGEFGGLIDTPESAASAPPPKPAPMAEPAPNGAANGAHHMAAGAPPAEDVPSDAPKRGRPRRKAPAPRPDGDAPTTQSE